jgi:hypothetical protein
MSETATEKTTQVDLPKLFTVTSTGIVNGFHDVKVLWFANRPWAGVWPDLPWAAMTLGEEPSGYTKAAIQEFFTETEARALVEYLKRTDPEGAPMMEMVRLPIGSSMPILEWAGDESDGHGVVFPLDPKSDSGLPVKVFGYCNFNGRLVVIEDDGAFLVCRRRRGTTESISTPFANRAVAEAWMRHVPPDPRPIHQKSNDDDALPW